MQSLSPKLIIVDQSLRDFDGHHFEYDLAVAEAARQHGLDVLILAHAAFRPPADFPIAVEPWFEKSSYDAGRTPLRSAAFGALGSLPGPVRLAAISALSRMRHRLRRSAGGGRPPPLPVFGVRLAQGLATLQLARGDHVLIHTATGAEVQSLAAALPRLPAGLHIHLVLRRDAEEPDIVVEARGGWPAVLRTLHGAGVRLYADTLQLGEQYDRLLGLPAVAVLPIPHCLPPAIVSTSARQPGPLRLVYLGNARSEKGFDLLPRLATALQPRLAAGAARLILQSNIPPSLEAAVMARCVERLARYPTAQVELLDNALPVADFQRLLLSADIVLLPYRTQEYRRRSSGILVQAAVAGKPVVVPADTWLSSEAPPGASVSFGSPDGFAPAVADAIDRYPELAQAAQAAAPRMAQLHRAGRLVEMLLAPDTEPTANPAPAAP